MRCLSLSCLVLLAVLAAASAPVGAAQFLLEGTVDAPHSTRCRSDDPVPLAYTPATRVATFRCAGQTWSCRVVTGTIYLSEKRFQYDCDTRGVIEQQAEAILYPAAQKAFLGANVMFETVVRNQGSTPLENAAVAVPLAPSCNHTWGTIAPGETRSRLCSHGPITTDLEVQATVTATRAGAPVQIPLRSVVLLTQARLGLAVSPDQQRIQRGRRAPLAITVGNTGDYTLSNVDVADTVFNGCTAAYPGPLEPGQERQLACFTNELHADHDGRVDAAATAGSAAVVATRTYRVTLAPDATVFTNGFER